MNVVSFVRFGCLTEALINAKVLCDVTLRRLVTTVLIRKVGTM